jgi:hypothetical protein
MFCLLEYRESMLILRGLLILVLVITLGVSVSQYQLSGLTQRQESVGVLTIDYEKNGDYALNLLGASYRMKAVYPLGQINIAHRAIIIKTMNQRITIPTYIEIDCKKELALLDGWAKLLVVEAFRCKMMMNLYLMDLQEKIQVYRTQFR